MLLLPGFHVRRDFGARRKAEDCRSRAIWSFSRVAGEAFVTLTAASPAVWLEERLPGNCAKIPALLPLQLFY
jgi:hypothetical protein